jgi:putative redox protein
MNTSEIIYLGGLRTEAVHLQSKNRIVTDAPTDNNGRGEAFSPTDLLATSLGCCMLTIMGIVAERNNIDITGTRVGIKKIMASDPRRVSGIVVEFQMPRKDFSDKERVLLENAARTCPVAYSIHPSIEQEITFSY